MVSSYWDLLFLVGVELHLRQVSSPRIPLRSALVFLYDLSYNYAPKKLFLVQVPHPKTPYLYSMFLRYHSFWSHAARKVTQWQRQPMNRRGHTQNPGTKSRTMGSYSNINDSRSYNCYESSHTVIS
jgi:hypothetical protein